MVLEKKRVRWYSEWGNSIICIPSPCDQPLVSQGSIAILLRKQRHSKGTVKGRVVFFIVNCRWIGWFTSFLAWYKVTVLKGGKNWNPGNLNQMEWHFFVHFLWNNKKKNESWINTICNFLGSIYLISKTCIII